MTRLERHRNTQARRLSLVSYAGSLVRLLISCRRPIFETANTVSLPALTLGCYALDPNAISFLYKKLEVHPSAALVSRICNSELVG